MREQRDQLRFALTVPYTLAFLLTCCIVGGSSEAGEFPADNSRHVRLVKAKIRAAQFLSKATFGPTEESIDELAARINQVGYRRATSQWIDRQFDLQPTSHEEVARDIVRVDGNEVDMQTGGPFRYRYQAWWHIALTSEDQLRQRVAWALSQIFVIGDTGTGFNGDDKRSIGDGEESIVDWIGMSKYYDMLSGGASGTYRELLENVTYHPCMGTWLSSVRNRKASVSAGRFPDENYAREIMQLFSVGLYHLRQDGRLKTDENGELIPTYDNAQIKELGRLFTGFRYHHNTNTGSIFTGRNLGQPMQIYVREHDTNFNYSEDPNAPNTKTVFGTVLPPLSVPINEQSCKDEIAAGLDAIADHSNVAPFICRLLIQRLVKSNPSRAYMRRVTNIFNDNGRGVRGDLRAVVKAILTDPELYRGQRLRRRRSPTRVEVIARGTEYSRLREPINRITGLIRAMRPTSDYTSGYMMLNNSTANNGSERSIRSAVAQMPFAAPSVFNYYLPDFQPPGELTKYSPSRRTPNGALFAPEFQILNAVTSNGTLDLLRKICKDRYTNYSTRSGTRCKISFDLDPEIELARDLGNLDEIMQRFDLLLCNGTLSEDTKTVIRDAISLETENEDDENVERVEAILSAIVISPDCAVEQ